MSSETLIQDGIFPSSSSKSGMAKKFQNMISIVVTKIKEFIRKIILMIQKLLRPSQRATSAAELVIMEYHKIIGKYMKVDRETLDITTIPGLSTYNENASAGLSQADVDKGASTLKSILDKLISFTKSAFGKISQEAEKLVSKDNEMSTLEYSTIMEIKKFNPKNFDQADYDKLKSITGDISRLAGLSNEADKYVEVIQRIYRDEVMTAISRATKSEGRGLHDRVKEVIISLIKKHASNIISYCRDSVPAVKSFLGKIEKRAHDIEKRAQFCESFSNTVRGWSATPQVGNRYGGSSDFTDISRIIYLLSQSLMRTARNYNVLTTYVGKNLPSAS